MNTTTTTTTNTTNTTEIMKGENTMENTTNTTNTVRALNRAAARRLAASDLRNAIIDNAAAYYAAIMGLSDNAAAAAALAAVQEKSAALAAALAGKRNGAEVKPAAVPAAVLFALAAPAAVKGTLKDGKRLFVNVRKEGYLKGLYFVQGVAIADGVEYSDMTTTDKDYLKDKPAAEKGVRSAAPLTPFDKFVSRMYSMDKEASKKAFYDIPANLDKPFSFVCLKDWKEGRLSQLTAAAAVMGIAA